MFAMTIIERSFSWGSWHMLISPITWEAESGIPQVQGLPGLQSEFKSCLGSLFFDHVSKSMERAEDVAACSCLTMCETLCLVSNAEKKRHI